MGHTFVKDVMEQNVISIASTMTVKDAADVMTDANVGCVVVTKGAASVGILTERDFVRRIAAKEKPFSTPVSEVMSSPLIVINPEETVWEAAELMKTRGIRKVPVEEDGRLVGIVTSTDLVNICSLGSDSEMRNICDQILLRIRHSQKLR